MNSTSEGNVLERIWPQGGDQVVPWTGAAAITAGVLLFLSNLFSEFLLPGEKDGEIVRLGLGLVYIAAYGVGAVALVLALRGLSTLHRRRGELTRAGHNGLRVAAAGAALQALFAAVYFATAAATGDAVDAAFFLYALGFLLLIGGSLTAGVSMIRTGVQRPVGTLLLVAGAMAIVTIVTPAPVHDVGLFLFDAAWIGIGLAIVSQRRSAGYTKRVATVAAIVALAATLVPAAGANGTGPPTDVRLAAQHGLHQVGERRASASEVIARNFEVLGHEDLGLEASNADVWVHGSFAYVGTSLFPCSGRGVKIVDVSNLREPEMIGTLAGRTGTSAEDMVVRTVSTEFFEGDLLAVGIQGPCSEEAEGEDFGLELWDVSNFAVGPPVKLGEIALSHGEGGVHELDLFQRGSNVYALVATPFSEFFDPVPGGDFRIIDVTNPRMPVQVGEWGANAHALAPGPLFGQGSFGATAGHSARASADGMKAYVSYRDIGVLTLDISDVTDPTLLTRTRYPKGALDDGEAHSVSEYFGKRGHFLLQNDEDFDPRSPAHIRFAGGRGIGNESHHAAPLWLEPRHRVKARVVMAANQGCNPGDYPANTAGKIAVVRFPFPFFDSGFVPGVSEEPFCFAQQQEAAAVAAGAVAVVHDFVAESTSPQFIDFEDLGEVDIPALFTDHATAQGMVAAGKAELRAQRPTWGFLRVFDSATGKQVAKFDKAPNVGTLPPPEASGRSTTPRWPATVPTPRGTQTESSRST